MVGQGPTTLNVAEQVRALPIKVIISEAQKNSITICDAWVLPLVVLFDFAPRRVLQSLIFPLRCYVGFGFDRTGIEVPRDTALASTANKSGWWKATIGAQGAGRQHAVILH